MPRFTAQVSDTVLVIEETCYNIEKWIVTWHPIQNICGMLF